MALIPGTNVSAKIVPFDTSDDFATHDSLYGQGGLREVSNLTQRDLIPLARQRVGMIVYVENIDTYYKLTNTGEPATFDVWTVGVSGGSPGGSGGASSFLELIDTPDSYVGEESSVPIVSGGQLLFQGMLTGRFDLDTINKNYTISDSRIKQTSIVIANVIAPTNELLLIHNVHNIQNGSFDVVLSDIPSVSGYSMHWVAYGFSTT